MSSIGPPIYFKDLSLVDQSVVSEVMEAVTQVTADACSVLFPAVYCCQTLRNKSGGTHEIVRRSHFAVLERFH